MPVRFLLEKMPAQCDGIIAANPFLLPTKKFPDGISAEDQQRLTKAITDAVNNEVIPAYKKFAAFIATAVRAAGSNHPERRVAAGRQGALPQRHSQPHHHQHLDARIRFTRSACSEIDRIEGEMLVIARKAGLQRCGLVPRIAEDQCQVHPHLVRADSRRLPQVHRADAAEASGTVRLHSRARRSRSKPYRPFRRAPPRTIKPARPTASVRARQRRHVQFRAPLADRRRGHRLSRRHPGTSHAALGGAANDQLAEVSPALRQLRLYRGLGAVCRATRQGSRVLPGPGQRLRPA